MNVGVIGASGYSGEVLVRLLLRHPSVDLVAVTSRQHAGKLLESITLRIAYSSSQMEQNQGAHFGTIGSRDLLGSRWSCSDWLDFCGALRALLKLEFSVHSEPYRLYRRVDNSGYYYYGKAEQSWNHTSLCRPIDERCCERILGYRMVERACETRTSGWSVG